MVNYDMMKEVRIYNREETISSISGAGENGQLNVKRMKLECLPILYTKINSRSITNIKVRLDTIKQKEI